MRLQRLVLHAGADDEVFTLDLHPRLTVITGAGRLEREGLLNEILGSLGSSRPGVHLELTDAQQRSLAVFRPAGARHRVVDIDRGVDVTAEFERDGAIDLLAGSGITRDQVRRRLCITGTDLSNDAHRDDHVSRLAAVDQDQLWQAADALREVQAELAAFGAEAGSNCFDAELVALIEARHGDLQQTLERLESIRSSSFITAGALCLFAVLSVIFGLPLLAVPLLAGATGAAALSVVRLVQVRRAEQAEAEVLRSAGMSSYLAFQLQRVDGLVSSHEHRRRLVALSEIHAEALEVWRRVAGDTDVEWAWEHRHDIAATLPSAAEPDPVVTGLVAILADRLAALHRCGPVRPPVVLDEPFATATDDDLRELVSVVLDSSQDQQLVLLTEDPRLADWARLEQMGGTILHFELDGPDPATSSPAARTDGRHALA